MKQSVTTRQAAEHYGIHVGRNGMACCPFHNDKTPSMKLDRRYHCFGCGADGDVIDFARLYGWERKKPHTMADFGLPMRTGNRRKAKKPNPGKPRNSSGTKNPACSAIIQDGERTTPPGTSLEAYRSKPKWNMLCCFGETEEKLRLRKDVIQLNRNGELAADAARKKT